MVFIYTNISSDFYQETKTMVLFSRILLILVIQLLNRSIFSSLVLSLV
jgi:hypothetical protein